MTAIRFYGYIHCHLDMTPFYVGKGRESRMREFSRRSDWHKRVVAKYGRDNIVICFSEPLSEGAAFAWEIERISYFRSQGYTLVNMTDGGEGVSGSVMSAEARAKIGAAQKGRKASVETRAKIGQSSRGRVHSAESRTRQSLSMCEALKQPELRAKLSAIRKGKPRSAEWRARVSHTLQGHTFSDASRAKISASLKAFNEKSKVAQT